MNARLVLINEGRPDRRSSLLSPEYDVLPQLARLVHVVGAWPCSELGRRKWTFSGVALFGPVGTIVWLPAALGLYRDTHRPSLASAAAIMILCAALPPQPLSWKSVHWHVRATVTGKQLQRT